jgi:8-oxo-dGTP pyrophosphatase MutT (NUDIX family)
VSNGPSSLPEPVFGAHRPGYAYTVRPSAYALLRDDASRVLIVRARVGWFLPGGGVEPGETAAAAAVRETAEECGLVIEAGRRVGSATEIVHSPAGHGGVEKASVFFEGVIVGTTTAAEPDHELAWLSPDEAIARLAHKSHQWAVSLLKRLEVRS